MTKEVKLYSPVNGELVWVRNFHDYNSKQYPVLVVRLATRQDKIDHLLRLQKQLLPNLDFNKIDLRQFFKREVFLCISGEETTLILKEEFLESVQDKSIDPGS